MIRRKSKKQSAIDRELKKVYQEMEESRTHSCTGCGTYHQLSHSHIIPRSRRSDLTTDINPPKELMVEIRVLQSCGEIYTDSGAVNLERNTTHYLRRSDIEPYIRKGFVEQIL